MENEADAIDIEAIMQEIRRQIMDRKLGGRPGVAIQGRRLPPAFYEALYQASLAQSELGVKLHVTRSAVPIAGPLLQWLRGKLHELVLFYVNQVAQQQAQVNEHLLAAISLLGQELEQEAEPNHPAR
jgi:hypothetical protein